MSTKLIPNLSVRSEGSSPLARLVRDRQDSPEYSRLRRIGGLLEAFHMKYSVTSQSRGRWAVINGKQVINFGSANYLGLDQHPEVIDASKDAIDSMGTHADGARGFATHYNVAALENELAALVGTTGTMIGHNVNQIHAGVIPTLFGEEGSVLFVDRSAHPSLVQGAMSSKGKGARVVSVNCEQPADLEQAFTAYPFRHGALLIDGIYGMQGQSAPLKSLDQICRKAGLLLYVDDAHGVGVLGESGGGAIEACGLSFDNVLMIGSLDKALGAYGGFVAGQKAVIDFLRVSSKVQLYSGTLQPAAIEGARAAVRVVRSAEGARRRAQVQENSRWLRARLLELGYIVPGGESPLVPVPIGADMVTLMAGRYLFDRGIFVNSIVHPVVLYGQGLLRISLTAVHDHEQMQQLVEAFASLRDYLQIIRRPMRGSAKMLWEVAKSKWLGDEYAGL
ncbi:MAG: aminotransferase class I/II-fold pyridoxal phosphate-dependent enzyme [Bdellovibrionales bacterium]|nr:aminotransferase class I/II-fold pyridoxal phosphate-dependent enzyme [Bdellovibrionales bacterium]